MFSSFLLCVFLLVRSSVGRSLDLDEMLHDPTTFAHQSKPAPPQEYTVGYLRTDYTDVGPEGKFFVQAHVLAIGVCYSSTMLVTPGAPSAEPTAEPTAPPTTAAGLASVTGQVREKVGMDNIKPQESARLRAVQVEQVEQAPAMTFQKLTAVAQDDSKKTFTLYYTDYSDAACSIELDSFTVVQRFQSSALTSNGVQLKTDRRYIASQFLATAVPSFNNGHIISLFGSYAVCTGDPYEYMVGTDKCSNYLDFFGRAECTAAGLTCYEYPFSPVGTCAGAGTVFRREPLDCSNHGTLVAPEYASVMCVDVEPLP